MNEMIELKEATTEWINKANQIFGRTFPMPMISLRLKGGTAGLAYSWEWMIKYNPEIYIRHKEDFKNRTVPHELAHLIVNTLYGRVKSHGREWRSVMHKLGIKEVTRCHSYDVTGIKNTRSRPFVYACGCREFNMTKTLHRKMLMGQTRTCLKCRTRLTYKRTEMVA